MAVIYLRHPKHGEKVACSEHEAEHDREHGWEDFDPTVQEPGADVPDFLTPMKPETASEDTTTRRRRGA